MIFNLHFFCRLSIYNYFKERSGKLFLELVRSSHREHYVQVVPLRLASDSDIGILVVSSGVVVAAGLWERGMIWHCN
jgi:hypothetical protein